MQDRLPYLAPKNCVQVLYIYVLPLAGPSPDPGSNKLKKMELVYAACLARRPSPTSYTSQVKPVKNITERLCY